MLWDQLTRGETLAKPIWEWDGSGYQEASYGALLDGARRAAAGLRRRGVTPGEIVPAVITNGPEAARGVAGIWFAGATVASLPIIARGMRPESYLAQLRDLCALLQARRLLADSLLVAVIGDRDLGVEVIDYASLAGNEAMVAIEPPALEDVIFIQFSSGTTGQPRGVELTGRAIESMVRASVERERLDPERDLAATWLPMSHDMGFFGTFLERWYGGISTLRSSPERFLQNPRSWFDDCADFAVTLTVAPPFALALAARADRIGPPGKKLSLRSCVVGAERIDWPVLRTAAGALERRGVGLEVVTPAYGLAEATLAVTLAQCDAPPRYVDRAREGDVRRLVSCGAPLDGVGVRIDEPSGQIVVSGPILGSGYHRDPEATEAHFRGGELWTGDLGLMADGELYVLGRSDDIVIIGGRNVNAQDVEDVLGAERGLRKGNCAVVDIPGDGGTEIAVVAELDGDGVDARALSMRLRKAGVEAAGLAIDRFVFLPRGAFPKTPSGKAQRYRCRAIAQQPVGAVEVVQLGIRRSASWFRPARGSP